MIFHHYQLTFQEDDSLFLGVTTVYLVDYGATESTILNHCTIVFSQIRVPHLQECPQAVPYQTFLRLFRRLGTIVTVTSATVGSPMQLYHRPLWGRQCPSTRWSCPDHLSLLKSTLQKVRYIDPFRFKTPQRHPKPSTTAITAIWIMLSTASHVNPSRTFNRGSPRRVLVSCHPTSPGCRAVVVERQPSESLGGALWDC